MKKIMTLLPLYFFLQTNGQITKYPIIDVHMHAYSSHDAWLRHLPNPVTGKPLTAEDADEHYDRTLAEMKKWNYKKAVISGDTTAQWLWKSRNPNMFITGMEMGDNGFPDLAWLREAFRSGKVQVLGEIDAQYYGIAPDSSLLEPYYALAEEFDIPVAIHIGPGPPGAAYIGYQLYRMKLSDPLALEEVLIRHPKLRVQVMHAGWPMADRMIALLYAHPQVYVDLGVIDWTQPVEEFHYYLKRLLQAGFGKRIMYGSDQMAWPESISMSITNILNAKFLTEEQKKDIFYRNAERFLRIKIK